MTQRTNSSNAIPQPHGFTLVEMSIVLAIVALLLGGLLPLISGQIEQQRRNETRKHLADIQNALLGYAIINGSLPCPTTTADPSDTANYGISPATCSNAPTAEGYLPWKTLGVPEVDAWGSKRSATTDSWLGYWRYRVDRNFTTTFALTTGFSSDKLSIVNNSNVLITPATSGCSNTNPTSECPLAIVFSTGPDVTANGENSTFESSTAIYQSDEPSPTFDDILIWISRPQLFNRMVAAGKLP
jgi:prepilin-type N-terminal cleavage/methylation domain-containing protein